MSGTGPRVPNVELDISGMNERDALENIGQLIDASQDALSTAGTDRAFLQLDEFAKREVPPHLMVLAHYFRANAWDNRMKIAHRTTNPWAWEQPERQEQILELRRAITHPGFNKLHAIQRCQILTNLANNQSHVGRFI